MERTTDSTEAVTTGVSVKHMPTPTLLMLPLTGPSVRLEDVPMVRTEVETVVEMAALARKRCVYLGNMWEQSGFNRKDIINKEGENECWNIFEV